MVTQKKKDTEFEELVARTRLMLQRGVEQGQSARAEDSLGRWQVFLGAMRKFRPERKLVMGDRPTFNALLAEFSARDASAADQRIWDLLNPLAQILATSAWQQPAESSAQARSSRDSILPLFVSGDEQESMAIESLVSFGYRAILGREADPEGRAHYELSLRSGQMQRIDFLRTLHASQEAANRGPVFRPFISGLDDPSEVADVLNIVLTALLGSFLAEPQ